MSNISEFERTKPKETHKAFEEARKKYEAILRETTVMDDVDAARVEMTSIFLKDLKEIYKKFLGGL
jgi:DNA-binding IscR family transcriptional regulator